MFETIRKYSKILMIPLYGLIILGFVFSGVQGYRGIKASADAVAKIGSHSISQAEWDAAHQDDVKRIRSATPNADPKLLDSPEARYATLERMVREKVWQEVGQDAVRVVTDARLAREIEAIPAIAAMRRADGSLDVDAYKTLLKSNGLSPAQFDARVRNELLLRQNEQAFGRSAFATQAVTDATLNAFFQRREVQLVYYKPADYLAKVKPTDAEIQSYYEAHKSQFESAESADIEYVVLNLDAVKSSLTVNEADLKTYYEQNAQRLAAKEERKASHILFAVPKDAAADVREKAKAAAQALLVKVRAKPDSFADLARKNSQDSGSATQGGDLGYFSKGSMVKQFEDAVFALKKGEISEVVESDFGYHIIKLSDIKEPRQASFESVRDKLELEYKAQQAQRKFAEVAEVFSNAVYEQGDSLKPVADKLKLEIKQAAGVLRKPPAKSPGALFQPRVLEAIFNADTISKKQNTEAIEVAPSTLFSARVIKHVPVRALALDEVRAQVHDKLALEQATALAKKAAEADLTTWKAQSAPPKLPEAMVISRDAAPKVSSVVLDGVLRADTSTLPVWVGIDMTSQGYALARITQVMPRKEVDAQASQQDRAQFTQLLGRAEAEAYYQMLKLRYKVQINAPKPGIKPVAQAEAG
jgi:peptidyl-prolyl cis-trans isomerase D